MSFLSKIPRGRRMMLIAGVAVALLVAGFVTTIVLYRASGSQLTMQSGMDFQPYISAYTSGIVQRASSIRVVLARDAVPADQVGQPVKKGILKFSPRIKGEAVWVNARTLELTPSEHLESGERYVGYLQLDELFENVPSKAQEFQFYFQVIEQQAEVSHMYYYTNGEEATLRGVVATADEVDPEALQKALVIEQGGKRLEVRLESGDDSREFQFTTSPLQSQEGEVRYSIKGKSIDAPDVSPEVYPLPEGGTLHPYAIQVDDYGEQRIRIFFNRPLDARQNLNGLVYLADERVSFTRRVDGNVLSLYPASKLEGEYNLQLVSSIRDAQGGQMQGGYQHVISLTGGKPTVAFIQTGSVLPSTGAIHLPFRAQALRAVDVTVYRIYESNLPQYFQVNDLRSDWIDELNRVGEVVLRKTVDLGSISSGKPGVYALDLSQLVQVEPGALYRVGLSMRRSLSAYKGCESSEGWVDLSQIPMEQFRDYNWNERNDPCTESYYNYCSTEWRVVLVSNIGLIAKREEGGSMRVYSTSILDSKPLSGVSIKLLNYSQQPLAEGSTDGNGECILNFAPEANPFLVVAQQGNQRSYLPVQRSDGLSFSTFDVSGSSIEKGLQGFMYGERDVWRPGDSIFMSLILEDKLGVLPENHPVEFTLFNPQRQVVDRKVLAGNQFGMYTFVTRTEEDAVTGFYSAQARIGDVRFHQSVRVETIKPNRLKMNVSLNGKHLVANRENPMTLSARWLHGAAGRNLQADVEARVVPMHNPFKGYDGYTFRDITSQFSSLTFTLLDGHTDENGLLSARPILPSISNAPGMLNAKMRIRVFEEGGGYSITSMSKPLSPFSSYVGLKEPASDRYYLETDTRQRFELMVVTPDGEPVPNSVVNVSLYKLRWDWWWEHDDEYIASYIESNASALVEEFANVRTDSQGRAEVDLRVNYPEWGRYLVRAVHGYSGHVASKVVYWDWPESRARGADRATGSTVLGLVARKGTYEVGDKASVTVPTPLGGTLLVSIENGSKVVKTFWAEAEEGQTEVTFGVTGDMAPNVYVNVTLLQPYGQTANDLPLRMYGVVPVMVENPETHLTPVIDAPSQVRPEGKVNLSVKEKSGKPMAFTVAVVDEGLLDITNFATPKPWDRFYARHALGVQTMDLFDHVIGAYGGRITSILSVGGDEEMDESEDEPTARRFVPVVRFFGPYHLEKGKRQDIEFQMPNYIGSVRIMAIAGEKGAYGSADAVMTVSNPLMVQATLPRVLGVNEELELPITVFSTSDKIRDVQVSVEVNGLLSVDGATRTMQFDGTGDQTVSIPLSTSSATGIARVKVKANGNGESASTEIELQVRNPNPRITNVASGTAAAGKKLSLSLRDMGPMSDAIGTVEVSDLPSLNLPDRLAYMQSYPHACLEQQTSRAFVQMLYGQVVKIEKAQQDSLSAEVRGFISRVQQFQLPSGGFSLWPNMSQPHYWGTSYVGHFLLMARDLGYSVPNSLLSKWGEFQRREAQGWSIKRSYDNSALMQAYRLYVLALAKKPESGAMNRLRELADLPTNARWRLAAAYALSGNKKVADALVDAAPQGAEAYRQDYYSFGSQLRDQAMLLESLTILKNLTDGVSTLESMASVMSTDRWLSTQEIGFAMLAYAQFAKASKAGKGDVKGELVIDGKSYPVDNGAESFTMPFFFHGSKAPSISFTNKSKGMLFVTATQSGVPTQGVNVATSNGIECVVHYLDMDGRSITPDQMRQGTDFVARVMVSNPGTRGNVEQLALDFALPAGWEVRNERIEGSSQYTSSLSHYQDYRDDRVYTYFDLEMGETKTFYFTVNASYLGRYLQPAVSCSALYDGDISASTQGGYVRVSR